MTERPIDNALAYEYYLQARKEIWLSTDESVGKALKLLRNGLDIVGENESLYAMMGEAYVQYINMGIRSDESYLKKADECARKVFELNPESLHGHPFTKLSLCIDHIEYRDTFRIVYPLSKFPTIDTQC